MSEEFNRQMVIVTDASALATILDHAGSKRERLYAAMLKLYPEEDWFWQASDIYADCVSHNQRVIDSVKRVDFVTEDGVGLHLKRPK